MKNKYLGACWEWFTFANGERKFIKLWVYLDASGERRFAPTQQAAREAVRS